MCWVWLYGQMSKQGGNTFGSVKYAAGCGEDHDESIHRLQQQVGELLVGQKGRFPVFLDFVYPGPNCDLWNTFLSKSKRSRRILFTVMVFQEGDGWFKYSGLVHFAPPVRNHRAQLVDQQVELISALFFAKISRFPEKTVLFDLRSFVSAFTLNCSIL